MNKCKFCELDKSKYYNTVLDSTNNFIVVPTIGSLVDGYVLIVSKKHFYNMLELEEGIKLEYLSLVNKYRLIFKKIYGKYPIIFEHGTYNKVNSASSIIHAHTHIVNHTFYDENKIITDLNFKEFNIFDYNITNNYIIYVSNHNDYYISSSFESKSQLMRYYIAKDLNLLNKYDWNKCSFSKNIKSTINKIKNY